MNEPKVQVRNVSKTYHDARLGDVKAIETIDISISNGEIYCLLGPSGCGKSTLLNMVAGFDTPTEGSIQVARKSVEQGKSVSVRVDLGGRSIIKKTNTKTTNNIQTLT